MQHLHFLGIAGSFMTGLARLASELGYAISGSDRAFHPPMGEQLQQLNIPLFTGYETSTSNRPADEYIIGNAISRGNPLMESILRQRLPYHCAAQWLYDNVLKKRQVIAVAGTHGKTTTTALLTYLLERAGLKPGFLLGGVAQNFGTSARLSPQSPFFVIEADEYDSAFFDKRPKFIHYRPQTLILNHLEFDHADIYPDMDAIIRQFHYLLRSLPDNGRIIARAGDANLTAAMAMGVYSPVEYVGDTGQWRWQYDHGQMSIIHHDKPCCCFTPPLAGAANRDNIVAAVAAATAVGVDAKRAGEYLQGFQPPLRRLQQVLDINGIRVFDDFAHHPTAIEKTIAAVAESRPTNGRIIAIFELRSNSMKAGVFRERLATALAVADIIITINSANWLEAALAICQQPVFLEVDVDAIVARIRRETRAGDDVLIMSNGDFGGLIEKLKQAMI